MKALILTFAFLSVGNPTESAFSVRDVCAKKDLCYYGENIACQADSIKLCPGGKMIKFTSVEKAKILDDHNKLRSELASGKISGLSQAARMSTMTWDNELSKMVELNLRRCVFGHDTCHNTKNYPHSGQNLAYVKGYNHGTFDRRAAVKKFGSLIVDWFAENKNADMSLIRNFSNTTEQEVSEFSVMSIDENNRVGCAAVWYIDEDGFGSFILVCNYASDTMIDQPIYTEGPTASQCKSGRNKKYPGLCAVNEKY